MDNFTLDKCAICGKYTALKNGACIDCDKETEMPNFLKDLFEDKN